MLEIYASERACRNGYVFFKANLLIYSADVLSKLKNVVRSPTFEPSFKELPTDPPTRGLGLKSEKSETVFEFDLFAEPEACHASTVTPRLRPPLRP